MFKNFPSFLLSFSIHGALIAVLVFGYDWQTESQQFSPKPVEIVKAVVIDDGRFQAEMKKLKEEAKRKQFEEDQRQVELERQAELAEQTRETEAKRLVELEKKQEEEKKRQAEEKVKQEIEVKRLAEVKKKEDAEKKKQEALKVKKDAEEKKRDEQENKKKAEEKRLVEEAERKKEKEAIEAKAAEEAQVKREAELQREHMAEKRRLETLLDEYKTLIAQRVERHWRRPSNVKPGLSCVVKVKQIPGGDVVDAEVGVCNGDQMIQDSIKKAVLRASPLPMPSDPALFDRNLEFNFIPKD